MHLYGLICCQLIFKFQFHHMNLTSQYELFHCTPYSLLGFYVSFSKWPTHKIEHFSLFRLANRRLHIHAQSTHTFTISSRGSNGISTPVFLISSCLSLSLPLARLFICLCYSESVALMMISTKLKHVAI